jgi:hypothetical protein
MPGIPWSDPVGADDGVVIEPRSISGAPEEVVESPQAATTSPMTAVMPRAVRARGTRVRERVGVNIEVSEPFGMRAAGARG